MNTTSQINLKLIHCGNINISNPGDKEQKNIFFMPMGLFALADNLKKNGVEVEIIHSDLESGKSIREILNFDSVDAVGLDLHWVNQAVHVMDTVRVIKQINPGIFIFLGGFSASLFAEEILLNFSQVDAVIKGDGEVPIVELCRVLRETKAADKNPLVRTQDLEKVRNLAWRNKYGGVSSNPITYIGTPEEINKLDFASLELLRNYESYISLSTFYTTLHPFADSPLFLLEVGRGCQYKCTFCGGNCVAQKKINNRKATIVRSIDSIISTIKKAVTYGFKTFYTCLEFENSDEWYIKLAKRISMEGLDINYVHGCWRLPSKALAEALSENFRHVIIEISPETADLELRRKNKDMRLYYTNEQLETFLDFVKDNRKIKIQLFFGYYLTGDTKKTILRTIEYILMLLLKYPHLLEIEYANFSTDPGSLFFFFAKKYNMELKVQNLKDYVKQLQENYVERKGQQADMTVYKPKNLSDAEDKEIHRIVRLLNYLFSHFRKSVSYLLKKTDSPHIMMTILKTTAVPITPDNTFPAHEIKETLIDFCEKSGVLDECLLKLITSEFEQLNLQFQVSLPTTQLRMDLEFQRIINKNDIVNTMMRYINSKYKIEAEDQSLEAGFQLS